MTRSAPAGRGSRWLGVLALLPVLLAAAPETDPPNGRVTAVRLAPNGEKAELLIQVQGGAQSWSDLSLDSPPRLVIDIAGARNGLPSGRFTGVDRGGVAGVRASQYSADVVRVVVDLQRKAPYTVTTVPEGIRVEIDSNAGPFEAWSSAGDAAPARPAEAPRTVSARSDAQPRITVTFQEADVRDVLASFAEFSGRSIVPGSGVQGSVTATIRNQPWDVALKTILSAYALAAQELPSGIIQVDAIEKLQQRETQEPLVTRTFRINYVPVGEVMATLQPLSSERGKMSANASTNTLIVTDVQSILDDMDRMVQSLDVRTPQVSIQAKIIFVNRTDVEELGFTYDLKDTEGSSFNRLVQVEDPLNPGELTSTDFVSLSGNSIAALGNANVRVQGPMLETVVSLLLGRFTLVTFIDALQAAELSDVQAAPLITTLDNQEAEIWVGERTPIRVVDVGGAEGGIGGARASAQLVETGIRLRVTPHITADRRILMDLHAERSSAQLAATDIGVIFQQQQGKTRLMVEDGETAVIGGLTVTEVQNTRAGIPFLMDIPGLGWLFRVDRTREQKRDLLIMVTPRIVESRS